MKEYSVNCDIARDLMPLVIDEAASEAAREAVNGHVEGCAACREIMADMQREERPSGEGGDTKFIQFCKKMERQFTRQRLAARLGASLLIIALLLGLGRFAYYQMNEHSVPMRLDGDIAGSVKFYQDQFGYVYTQFEVTDARHPWLSSTTYTANENGRRKSHIVPEQPAWPHLFGSEGMTGIIADGYLAFQFIDGQLCEVYYDSWLELDENGAQVEHNELVSSIPIYELWLGDGNDAVLLYRAGDALPPVVKQAAPGTNG